MRYAEYPSIWYDSSPMNAPIRPAKFAGGTSDPVLKNHTGSDAL
jgi:hypothetical protein